MFKVKYCFKCHNVGASCKYMNIVFVLVPNIYILEEARCTCIKCPFSIVEVLRDGFEQNPNSIQNVWIVINNYGMHIFCALIYFKLFVSSFASNLFPVVQKNIQFFTTMLAKSLRSNLLHSLLMF